MAKTEHLNPAFLLRMPRADLERCRKAAKRDGRTLTNWMVQRLREALEENSSSRKRAEP